MCIWRNKKDKFC
uniref:Uncharacterized protein n=1 Tax=Arundo donax TaxID=35708 RepID=A0A0A9FTE9_ARUDO